MALVEVKMPQMGESVMEATIISWLKKEGEKIEEEEALLEVATDKVDTEVPSMITGVLKEILAREGDVVQIGQPIAMINTETIDQVNRPDNSGTSSKNEITEVSGKTNGINIKETVREGVNPQKQVSNDAQEIDVNEYASSFSNADRFYSPLVRNIAKEEHISMHELEQIAGSGKEGRVTKNDILNYLKQKQQERIKESHSGAPFSKPTEITDEDEVIVMDRVRKIIADRMVESRRISAHVHSFVEADVTNIVNWRERIKNQFEHSIGEKLTFSPIFIEAVVKALKDYPMMNISVQDDKIIKKKRINIGMAVALPNGNLIVPVIKNADQLNLAGLARQVNDLALRGRNNELHPDEITGSTYTVTNVGVFGSTMGTPIILQPNVGILALGAVEKKVSVLETKEYGDVMAIRQKITLSHSYDHRVIDGALGSMFVRRVADYLENFDINRSF